MRFRLIDRIVDLQPGSSITAIKTLSLAEEYLADHFPLFPVMPGVLMLESMYQASAWLVRRTDDFAQSMVTLQEARNVRYADFVQPGQVLKVRANILKRDGNLTSLKAQGTVEDRVAVSARLILESFCFADEDPRRHDLDLEVLSHVRPEFDLLYVPDTALQATT